MKFKVLSRYEIHGNYIVGFMPVKKEYEPDINEDIYIRFMKIEDEKSLLKFVENYGLLGLNQTAGGLPYGEGQGKVYEREILPLLDNIFQDKEEGRKGFVIGEKGLMSYDKIDEIYRQVDRMRKVTEVLREPDKFPDKSEEIEASYGTPGFEMKARYISNLKTASILENSIKGRSLSINYNKKKKEFAPSAQYTHLLPALWYSLFKSIVEEGKKWKQCPVCLQWHTARGKQIYCPPLEGQDISSCAMTQKQRNYRKNKKAAQ